METTLTLLTLFAATGQTRNDLQSMVEEAFLLGLFGLHVFLMKQSRRDSTGLTLTINWYAFHLVTAPLLGYWMLFNLAPLELPSIWEISPWMFHGAVFIYALCWLVGATVIAITLFRLPTFVHLKKVNGKWRVMPGKKSSHDDVIEIRRV